MSVDALTRVREVVDTNLASSTVLEQPIRWKPAAWKRADLEVIRPEIDAAEHVSEELEDGRQCIRRKHVLRLRSEFGERGVFAATMIWGYGPVGYGASRTARIVSSHSRDDLGRRLAPLAVAASRGPGDAWDAITDKDTRIRGLGTAFGTKVTYFLASSADRPPAPLPLIADINTSWAIWDLCAIPRSAFGRSNYLCYVETAHRWAQELQCPVDEIERALFEHGKTVRRKHVIEAASAPRSPAPKVPPSTGQSLNPNRSSTPPATSDLGPQDRNWTGEWDRGRWMRRGAASHRTVDG
jgi:hypothetical protein